MKEITDKIINVLKKGFDERQKKPYQYVVGYYRVDNDKLIGYHASSFCQIVKEKENGKRYNGEDPYKQLAIIRKNLDHTLDIEEAHTIGNPFASLSLDIKKRHFNDMKKEDIYINAEYLDDSIPPQKFIYHKIGE